GGIVPQQAGADAHARRDKIVEIPLAQENPVAVKLSAVDAGAARPAEAGNIGALEVRAEKHRARRARRSGEKSLRAPEKQIVADQKHIALLFAVRAAAIFVALKAAGHAQRVRSHFPGESRHQERRQAVADAGAGVEQTLAPAVAQVLDAQPPAGVGQRTVVVVAEPAAHLELQPRDPFILELGKRLDAEIGDEVLLVGETLKTVVAFADAGHRQLETVDAAGNAAPVERPVVPVEHDALARAAVVKADVTRQKIVFRLGADRARALTRGADGRGNIHAELHRGQPGMHIFQVDVERAAVKNASHRGAERVLGIAGAEAVEIENHFELPQAIIDAVIHVGAKAPREHVALAAPHLIAAALEQHAKMRFDAGAQRPGLVRGLDHQAVAGAVSESRQRGGGRGGLLFHFDLLFFERLELGFHRLDSAVQILAVDRSRRPKADREHQTRGHETDKLASHSIPSRFFFRTEGHDRSAKLPRDYGWIKFSYPPIKDFFVRPAAPARFAFARKTR